MKTTRLGRRCFCGGAAALLAIPSVPRAESHLVCNFSVREGWTSNEYLLSSSRPVSAGDPSGVPEALAVVARTLRLHWRLEVRLIQNTDNAFAVRLGNRRIVVADVNFLDRINSMVRTRGA